jgi:hypothetical protein
MQFKLTCTDEDGTITRKDFDGIFLDDVVAKTQDFLHGVGFVFDELDVIRDARDEEDGVNAASMLDEITNAESPDDLKTIASYYKQYRHSD